MSKNETKLTTKVSSYIWTDTRFCATDHPLFLKFLKDYYKFLEAGRLTITATVQNVQETVTTNYILQEDGERTVADRFRWSVCKWRNHNRWNI